MPSITQCFVLLIIALSASAFTAPHAVRDVHHRRAVTAHVAATAPQPVVNAPQSAGAGKMLRRRKSNAGRCKPKTSSKSTAASSTAAAVNVEPTPPSASDISKSTATPTPSSSPSEHSSTHASSTHTSSSKEPAASSSSSGGNEPSFLQGVQTGQGTYYGTGLGACGITNNDNQDIAAVSHLLFDAFPGYNGANPNQNPLCGKKVTAQYQGKSVTVTLTDRCVGCALTDLDFSPHAFSQIANQAVGRISGMTWTWDD